MLGLGRLLCFEVGSRPLLAQSWIGAPARNKAESHSPLRTGGQGSPDPIGPGAPAAAGPKAAALLTSISFTNIFLWNLQSGQQWEALSCRFQADSFSAEQPHGHHQNTASMSLNIPNAPNAGLFKQGYNR